MTDDVVERVEEHGTNRGYDRHRAAGEPACDPCLAAHAAYIREWRATRRTAAALAARNRYEAARLRALTRLGKAHPEEYAFLMRSELGELTDRATPTRE